MARIDYFFTPFSPWTYLAGDRLERIAAARGAQIVYRPLDLFALFDRTGGTRPAARHPSRMAYRDQELARWSAHLGMEMRPRPTHYPPNPAPASYAIIAAQNARARDGQGDVGALVRGILRALWVEDRDIAQEEVIGAALSGAGFAPGLTTSGLFEGAVAYERNLEEAVERGVFGAPFYIVAETDARFWGQDRLDFLDAHLAQIG